MNKLARVQEQQQDKVLQEKDEEVSRMKANLNIWKEEAAQRIATTMRDEFQVEWERYL